MCLRRLSGETRLSDQWGWNNRPSWWCLTCECERNCFGGIFHVAESLIMVPSPSLLEVAAEAEEVPLHAPLQRPSARLSYVFHYMNGHALANAGESGLAGGGCLYISQPQIASKHKNSAAIHHPPFSQWHHTA